MWVDELPNGRYRYREWYKDPITNKWKKVSVTLGSNSRQADKKARILLQERIEDKLRKTTATDFTLREVGTEFLEEKSKSIKQGTLKNYQAWFNTLLEKVDGDTLVSKITLSQSEKAINAIILERSSSYGEHVLFLLRQMLSYATRHGYINSSDFLKQVKLNKPPKSIEDLTKAKTKFLSKEELSYVLEELRKIKPRVAIVCEFLALTGLRIGELLALQRSEYDEQAHTITINGSLTDGVKGTPKNVYSYRTLPLNKRAEEIINLFIDSDMRNSDFIFKEFHKGNINYFLKKVPFRTKITSHIFRHTHISLLAELNLPLKAIMTRVGHSDPNTTLSIYTHVTAQMEKDLCNKLDTLSF